jgi:crotonobetainyl-CoA:carnitine CoA-transferase CaiB-like acyl-CoA transferase
MTEELERGLIARDRAEWQARFDEAGVPAGPILEVQQAFDDPRRGRCPLNGPW